jgi:hypothetical protein
LIEIVEHALELVGAGRLGRFLRLARVAFGEAFVARLIAPFLAFLGRLRLAVARLRLVVVLAVALGSIGGGAFLGELQRAQQITHQATEALLILGKRIEPLENLSAALLDGPTPHVDERLRRIGWRQPRQPLADHQCDCVLERGILLGRGMREAAMGIMILDACREVARHAGHAVGTQRLDTARSAARKRVAPGRRQAPADCAASRHGSRRSSRSCLPSRG